MKTYVTISLGCKVNSYETSALVSRLIEKGYTEDKNNPDVAIINTCSVTATADQKSRQHIRKLINNYPNALVVVMGCYSQGQHKFIKDEIKANIITGTSNRDKLVELIENYQKGTHIDVTDDKPRLFDKYEELGITSHSENVRAYLKIQDGCDNFCSYCLIPLRRGKSRSRNHAIVLKEATSLVINGYKEIVLTGIHVGGYGKDLEGDSFSNLVKDLLDIDGLYRLRISSIEESEIDDEMIELINTRDNLANHFHIPLQSGSDAVLKRMNRKYDKASFLKKIKKIKEACPNVALTTDVIVGFPGETEKEFNECYDFIKECGFNMLHVFPFSSREGTLAARLPNHVDPKIKKERTLKLIELSNELWNKYTDQFNGKEVEVLIEQYDEENHINIGHTSNYIEVKIKDNENKVGKIVKATYKK
jgi:threonylcarbamoyladenosine tRNA methylthiotransferase MtaB